jgi:hypothetical protein
MLRVISFFLGLGYDLNQSDADGNTGQMVLDEAGESWKALSTLEGASGLSYIVEGIDANGGEMPRIEKMAVKLDLAQISDTDFVRVFPLRD